MKTINSVSILSVIVMTLMFTPLVSAAQETRNPLQRLDAVEDDIDALTQAVEEIGDLGCSATQQDNSILITCGDGTSGVIAGAGTVVLYPEGQIGEVPPIDYNTGPIVAMDANGVVLGEVIQLFYEGPALLIEIFLSESTGTFVNLPGTQEFAFLPRPTGLAFTTEDCSGPAFIGSGDIVEIDNRYFIRNPSGGSGPILFKSGRVSGWWDINRSLLPSIELQYFEPSECFTQDQVGWAAPAVEYTFAPEIANAAYPVTVQQLPGTN